MLPLRSVPALIVSLALICLGCGEAGPSDELPSPTVRWIEVVAADYVLTLDPVFDEGTTQYDALANGPGITVWVEILTRHRAESVLVNGAPATRIDDYLWRSPVSSPIISPAAITVELPREGLPTLQYDLEVVTP